MVALLTFLAGPIGRWLTIAGIVAAALAGTYFKIKQIGWDEREAVAAKEEAERTRLHAELAAKRQAVSQRVVFKFKERVRVINEHGEEVLHGVEKLLPAGSCELPGGFRVLHDAAILNELPKGATGTDAAPVPAQDVAYTVISNYTTCIENAERLMALQGWVREQEALH